MAKISNPLIGAGRGRVGGVVMYRRKGENIIREHVAQIDDKSTGQQVQNRSAFSSVVSILAILKATIASYWTPSKSNQTPFSDCVGFNARTIIENDGVVKYDSYGIPYYDRSVDIVNLTYADQSQAPLGTVVVANAVAGTVTVEWDATQLGVGGLATDKIDIMLVNTTKKQLVLLSSPWSVSRSEEIASITYPSSWSGDNSLLTIMIRPADYSLPARQGYKGGLDLANVLK